jgi:pilus assembly protein FimV
MPGYANMPVYPNMPNPQPGQPGVPMAPGAAPGGAPNAATQMISDILTRPNPAGYAAVLRAQQLQQGGAPGMTGPGVSGATIGAGMAAGGSGMAGVASTAESDGIMVYNDRTAYNEWEFIFDPAKVPPIPPMPGGSSGGTPANRMGTPAGQMNQPTGMAGGAFGGGASRMGGAQGAGGMAQGAAGMRIGGDFSSGGAAGAQGAGVTPGAVAGMQMGGLGMTSTGLPANIRLGRP